MIESPQTLKVLSETLDPNYSCPILALLLDRNYPVAVRLEVLANIESKREGESFDRRSGDGL
jgi:hypothetical protein